MVTLDLAGEVHMERLQATARYTFEYSDEFNDMVLEMLQGKEDLPSYDDYMDAHLGGAASRIAKFIGDELPEVEFHLGDLTGKRILDFGCGTGAITAALAMSAAEVVAFDIDLQSTAICKKRLEEHCLTDKVKLYTGDDFELIGKEIGEFDLVMMHAVIEHIPLSISCLRERVVSQAFRCVKPGGHMYICETPNRLWPRDIHTTKMWWVPWTKAGSRWAYDKAMKTGKHADYLGAPHSPGPLGLEERGAWGMTYWEFRSYLTEKSFCVVNTIRGHDRHVRYTRRGLSGKRRIFESLIYWSLTRWAGIPIVALCPMFSPLIVRRDG